MEEVILCIVTEEPEYSKIASLQKYYSQRLGSEKALQFPPHITLANKMRVEDYVGLCKKLEMLSFKKFSLKLKGPVSFTFPKILYLLVESEQIQEFHKKVLKLTQAFRLPWIKESLKKEFPPVQRQFLEKYGSPYVLQFYTPHLTLAGPDVNDQFEKIIKNGENIEITIKVHSVSILKKKEQWVIDKKIKLK